MKSYHEEISTAAHVIETARSRIYDRTLTDVIKWDELETEWLWASLYKLLRIKNHTRARPKAMDDLIDVYNYVALLYERLHQQGHRPSSQAEIDAELTIALDYDPLCPNCQADHHSNHAEHNPAELEK